MKQSYINVICDVHNVGRLDILNCFKNLHAIIVDRKRCNVLKERQKSTCNAFSYMYIHVCLHEENLIMIHFLIKISYQCQSFLLCQLVATAAVEPKRDRCTDEMKLCHVKINT